jgi:hypothetical protein
MPTHYAFKTPDRTERLVREAEDLRTRGPHRAEPASKNPKPPSDAVVERVKAAIAGLDDQGRWLSDGRIRTAPDAPAGKVIDIGLCVRNIGTLTQYLAATRP